MKHVVLAVAAAVFVVGASAATPEPTAFQRPERADDRYSGPATSSWQISDSRLVAQSVVRRPNGVKVARLYLVRRMNRTLCIILRDGGGEGASCTSSSLSPNGVSLSGRLLAGAMRNDVTRVVVVGTRGKRHPVKLTRDKGLIWDCRAWNGCRTVIAAVEAYNGAGRLLYRINWQ